MDRQFFVIAHHIRSLHNVGAIFRTAEALGVTELFLTGITGKPPDPKIAKVALGAEQYLPWEYHASPVRLIKKLRAEFPDITVVGLENNLPTTLSGKLKTLDTFKSRGAVVLVLGQEVDGIPRNVLPLCDVFVEIPMRGKKESLNVSVAFGIAAYELGKS